MSTITNLMDRNTAFAEGFPYKDLPIQPKLRTVIISCADARSDPAHFFRLDPGEAVVIRNTGGRVTNEVAGEIATLAFMVARMEGGIPGPFKVVIVHHTKCGAQRFADPQFQSAIKQNLGIDVSELAISDDLNSLHEDISRLRRRTEIPDYIEVAAMLYDVDTGSVHEVVPSQRLRPDRGQST